MNGTFFCRRCDATIFVPQLTQSEQSRVAALVRNGDPVRAIRLIRETTGIELIQAKAIVMHITRTPGNCVRCAAALSGTDATSCERCGSFNLDW